MKNLILSTLTVLLFANCSHREAQRQPAAGNELKNISCIDLLRQVPFGDHLLKSAFINENEVFQATIEQVRDGAITVHQGQLSAIKLTNHFNVYVLRNDENGLFVFDSTSKNIWVKSIAPHSNPKIEFDIDEKKSTLSLNTEELRNLVCTDFKNKIKDPNFSKWQKYLAKHPKTPNLAGLKSLYDKNCGVAVGAMIPLMALYPLSAGMRSNGVQNAFTDHYSNFGAGLALMAGLDQCIKNMVPQHRNTVLASILGINSVANIYYELDLPGNWQVDALQNNKQTVTDVGDLVAGGSATLLYFIIAKALEQSSAFKFALICK